MITLTDSAASKVKELIDEEGDEGLALRVAVRGGGCSGLAYEMFFDTDISGDDVTSSYGDVQVVVVHEGDAAAEHGVERAPIDPLQVMLARFVGRVRLAGEHDLHRPLG